MRVGNFILSDMPLAQRSSRLLFERKPRPYPEQSEKGCKRGVEFFAEVVELY